MPPALKIVVDVALYRLRRLEMANMVGAVAIMWALHLPAGEFAIRLLFAFLLNLLVYLNNDYLDLEDDLACPSKDRDKTQYLRRHRGSALRAQLALAGALALIGWWFGGGLLLALVLGGGICWAYSATLKRMPYTDVLAMIAWGVAMPLVAVPWDSNEGWLLLVQLGLFSGVFETIQVMRDHDEDREQGVRTTAVVLGIARTKLLARMLLLLSAVYAVVAFYPPVAALPLIAAFTPVGGNYERYWTRIRMLLGPTLLIECAIVHFLWLG